ncbi:hypothetical protein FRC09_012140 [Ceratobasidium sp. 395]|nr:hypothetical protein FRC09_012140 [Ceratobasidium sp. 395]
MAAQYGGGPMPGVSYASPVVLPDFWAMHNSLASLIDNRPSANRAQWNVLRNQFKDAISQAQACYSRGEGSAETNNLWHILNTTIQYLYEYRDEAWTDAMYQASRPDDFILGKARELDAILQRFSHILRGPYQSTESLVAQARAQDRAWIDQFVEGVGRATPAHGDFAKAFQNRNTNELNTLANQVLRDQAEILSTNADLRDDEVRKASELTNWIMNMTKKRPEPGLLLGQRFVGPLEKFNATAKYDLFKSKFVTGETVVVKVLRDSLFGKDDAHMIKKFQKRAEMWFDLRSDYTLPFYGIGKLERDGQTQIYSVSPYMEHGDAIAYHTNYRVSAAESLQIALDVARGLQYLHEKRPPILHLGLCTNDVLINNNRHGVLGGFGLIEEAGGSPPTNHSGFANEFYRFLAPEHIVGASTRKTSGDVWAWAMVVLHIVGGQVPFCDSNDFQAANLASQGAKPKRERYPRVEEISDPDSFWRLLEECWSTDEARRPPMDDVVYRLKKLSKLDDVSKPLPMSVDQGSVGGIVDYGRIAPPVAQGRDPRRGQR